MKAYFDDFIATQPLRLAIEEYSKNAETCYMQQQTAHYYGRLSQNKLYESKLLLSKLLKVNYRNIFFTCNDFQIIINQLISLKKFSSIITGKFENRQQISALKTLANKNSLKINYVDYTSDFRIDLIHFENLLIENPRALVVLSHVSPITSLLLPVKKINKLTRIHNSYLFIDFSCSLTKIQLNISATDVDFSYINAAQTYALPPLKVLIINGLFCLGDFFEPVPPALASAFALSLEFFYSHIYIYKEKIENLKMLFVEKLKENDIEYRPLAPSNSLLYWQLPIVFKNICYTNLLCMRLDIEGVCVTNIHEMIIEQAQNIFNIQQNEAVLLFSLNHQNTAEEILFTIEKLAVIKKSVEGFARKVII